MKGMKNFDFGNSLYKFGLRPKTRPNSNSEFPSKVNQNQNFLFKNKQGDVPITILVIGVFAVCSLALLTFFISDFKTSNSFVGIDVMEKMNTQIDEYGYYQLKGVSIEKIQTYYRLIEEDGKKYIYLDKYSNKLFSDEEILLFSVRYPLPS